MDFIYLVDLNTYLSNEEIKLNDFCNCSLSNNNILALSHDCYTYILPLEKPNELIPVGVSNSQCLSLIWSDDGQYLLCFYKNGAVKVFSVKTSLLNSIEAVYSFQVDKNDLITIKSFSKSPKLCFNHEKRDSMNYLEKLYYKSFNFLKNSSKIAYNGFMFLTKSGILHFCLTDFNSVKNRFEKFEFDMNLSSSLKQMDNQDDENQDQVKFDLGDFSIESDGSINVIFTNFDLTSPILIFKVNLKFSNDYTSIEGTSELLATINVYNDSMTNKTHLMFTSNESAQYFCVSQRSNQTNCDIVQVWRPAHLNQNMIGSFDINMSNDQCTLIKTIQCPSSLIKLTAPKYSIAFKDLIDNRYLNEPVYLMASYLNGTFGFIDIQSYNQTFSSAIPINIDSFAPQNTDNSYLADLNTGKKVRFTQEYVLAIDQSHTGSIGVGITNFSRLVIVRQPFNKEINNSQHLVNLYEYSMLNGYDYWGLLMSTNPKQIDGLIEHFEDKYQNHLSSSNQKVYFTKHYSLMFSLYKRGITYNQFKSQDILTKLILNRLMSIISFSVQLSLNIDQIKTLFSTSSLNISLINSNLEIINQPTSMSNNPILSQTPFKNSLYEYISDLLRIKLDQAQKVNFSLSDFKALSLNDIVQSILSRKNFQLSVNQQVKHVFQWIIDIALYLTSVAPLSRLNQANNVNSTKLNNHFGSSLLGDLAFLNEIRKSIVFIKLLFTYSSNLPAQAQSVNFLIFNSLPVLPLRSSMQKDLLSDLFNIYTKIIFKSSEGGNVLHDESIIDQCLNIQAETIIRPMDELFFNLKYSWLGNAHSLWTKTLQFRVDHLFESEKCKPIYPLFDVIRLIQFSRSFSTKQCIRCGNYTEASKNTQVQNSKLNCIYMQDSCSEKCMCGGYWVLSTLQ